MSYADVAEECVQTLYPNKGWTGRLVLKVTITDFGVGGICSARMKKDIRNEARIRKASTLSSYI